ncbi:MAG: 4-hydroxythreonine-4-phosphate dehydrogenase PdxA [Alphaproteobacteria bacterium]|nr:4-hydroxythreonine-4-phosphate dehydrogenase PdxA [Alphaproteobacteria bacterium]MBV9693621.1 4-hydroxythreonine-4-phosphate dehydrogenase PdxA [Alphaproteobacteria bacterium]
MSKPAEPGADAPILLTMGEPAGIGPEIAVAAWRALGGRIGKREIKLVGDPMVFRAFGEISGDPILASNRLSVPTVAGKPDPRNASAVLGSIESAVKIASHPEAAAAVVTAPINKAVLMQAGFGFPGHTEYLAHLTGAKRAVMMLASDKLRVIPQTIHMPLKEVPQAISTAAIVETATIILAALQTDFSIARPRLAVAGLNPHPGEFGNEDGRVIAPAVEALKAQGHDVRGPLSADTLFHEAARATYDAALCMYHDQALIPIKTLSFWDGVNVTLGLPIVRTSPDHGTAFDIAGTGKADARSMIAAVEMAARIANARARG